MSENIKHFLDRFSTDFGAVIAYDKAGTHGRINEPFSRSYPAFSFDNDTIQFDGNRTRYDEVGANQATRIYQEERKIAGQIFSLLEQLPQDFQNASEVETKTHRVTVNCQKWTGEQCSEASLKVYEKHVITDEADPYAIWDVTPDLYVIRLHDNQNTNPLDPEASTLQTILNKIVK